VQQYCYPGNGKFGKEKINGTPQHYRFDTHILKALAQKAAIAIGLDIYGGDAIITPQGEIFIIDINDFPSFSAIRDIAAKEIATLIMNKTK
jgi:glutathione synthase/RimK-type ligase-like ATP-grasp enzyme